MTVFKIGTIEHNKYTKLYKEYLYMLNISKHIFSIAIAIPSLIQKLEDWLKLIYLEIISIFIFP